MAVYYGVVKDKKVVFEGDVPLTDGVRVEVRPRATERWENESPTPTTEEDFKRRLRAMGALAPAEVPEFRLAHRDRHLIEVKGQPLSEQIIAERR